MRQARPLGQGLFCLLAAALAGCGASSSGGHNRVGNPDWPFDQGPNVATFVSRTVVSSHAPVLTVHHYSDDHSWSFLNETELRSEHVAVVSMAEAVRLDTTLREVADLPPGWVAVRDRVGGPWIRTTGE